jgi:hypothetical protein
VPSHTQATGLAAANLPEALRTEMAALPALAKMCANTDDNALVDLVLGPTGRWFIRRCDPAVG